MLKYELPHSMSVTAEQASKIEQAAAFLSPEEIFVLGAYVASDERRPNIHSLPANMAMKLMKHDRSVEQAQRALATAEE